MSSTPWYNVGPFDVFPEEFRLFFSGNPKARKAFEQYHSDLYEMEFWRSMQEKILSGKVEDIYPYRRKKRFTRDIPAGLIGMRLNVKMKQLRFFSIIGMAGVSPHENAIARKWAARFDVALIPIAFIALLAWYDNKHGHTMMTATFHSVTDWAMCSFFLTELLWISYLCGDRWRYLKYNWFNLIVLIARYAHYLE